MPLKKRNKKNECEVRRYIAVEMEVIEKVPKKDYDGPKLDPEKKKELENNMRQLLGADSVTIKKVKDFVAD